MSNVRNNQGSKPAVRFKGFSDAWEQRKLSKVASFSKGAGYSKSDLVNSGHPIILYGQMYTNYQTVIRRPSLFVAPESSGVFSQPGDVIVPASGETAEDISRASVVESAGILLGGDINIIKPNREVDPEFLALTISNGRQKSEMVKRAQGSSIVHLHISDLKKIVLAMPSIREQQQISSLVSSVEATIALHQRKVENLQKLKKSLLQQMFVSGNDSVPKIRFAGFADAWEQRKLGNVFDTITDYVANGSFESLRNNVNSSDVDGFAYLVRLQDASNNWQGPWLYTDQHGYKSLKKSRLQPGDIIMANVGSVGKFFLVPELDKPMTLAPNAVLIKSSENDQEFLYQMMLTPEMQYKIFEKTTPGAQSKINKTDFKMIETQLPNIEEQNRIGNFFETLDNLIAVNQRKVENLQKLKKSLLHLMFI